MAKYNDLNAAFRVSIQRTVSPREEEHLCYLGPARTVVVVRLECKSCSFEKSRLAVREEIAKDDKVPAVAVDLLLDMMEHYYTKHDIRSIGSYLRINGYVLPISMASGKLNVDVDWGTTTSALIRENPYEYITYTTAGSLPYDGPQYTARFDREYTAVPFGGQL